MITLVRPRSEILTVSDHPLLLIESAGRTCYKSEDKITQGSAEKFVAMVTKRGHHSVIEHASATVRIICDRGVTNEIVRHRLAAYSQESTRYVNYKQRGIEFVIPPWVDLETGEYQPTEVFRHDVSKSDIAWVKAMHYAANTYNGLLKDGWPPEKARSVLPNSLKTEIVMTCNVREWRHVFNLRCSKACHPQMREVMLPLLRQMSQVVPVIFDDLVEKYLK